MPLCIDCGDRPARFKDVRCCQCAPKWALKMGSEHRSGAIPPNLGYCVDCGAKIRRKAMRCMPCSGVQRRKEEIERAELLASEAAKCQEPGCGFPAEADGYCGMCRSLHKLQKRRVPNNPFLALTSKGKRIRRIQN